MGTWSHLVDTVPELPTHPSTQDKIRARLAELADASVDDLTRWINANEEALAAHRLREKELNLEDEALTAALRYRLKALNMDGVVSNGYRWTPTPEPYPQVKDKTTFVPWVIEHMRDNVQLHHGTLKAVVKDALKGEGEMPPGVDIFLKTRFTRTKQK